MTDRITQDPAVLAGKPVVAGTRVSVELVLEQLAAGWTSQQVAREYGLADEDVRACLGYAVDLVRASHPAMAPEPPRE